MFVSPSRQIPRPLIFAPFPIHYLQSSYNWALCDQNRWQHPENEVMKVITRPMFSTSQYISSDAQRNILRPNNLNSREWIFSLNFKLLIKIDSWLVPTVRCQPSLYSFHILLLIFLSILSIVFVHPIMPEHTFLRLTPSHYFLFASRWEPRL